MPNLIVDKVSDNYICYNAIDKSEYEYGKTANEAIGKWMTRYTDYVYLNFSVLT